MMYQQGTMGYKIPGTDIEVPDSAQALQTLVTGGTTGLQNQILSNVATSQSAQAAVKQSALEKLGPAAYDIYTKNKKIITYGAIAIALFGAYYLMTSKKSRA